MALGILVCRSTGEGDRGPPSAWRYSAACVSGGAAFFMWVVTSSGRSRAWSRLVGTVLVVVGQPALGGVAEVDDAVDVKRSGYGAQLGSVSSTGWSSRMDA